MKTRLAVLTGCVLSMLAITGCNPTIPADPCRADGTPAGSTAYGAFTPRLANGTIRTTPAEMVTEGRALGADVLRAEQDITAPVVPERKSFDDAGLQTLLTIRNDPHLGDAGKPTVIPPHTPEDLATFKTNLKASLQANAPCLVAVENEEVGSPFVSGSASDYLAELKATIDVAHPLGIPVTNGGIVSGVSALLTWQDLSQHSGKPAADDFARRAFVKATQQKLLSNLLASTDGTLPPGPSADNLAKANQLIAAYRALPLDYVNFHWYIDNDLALTQTVNYLKHATGHPVITHEIGQYNVDPSVVTGHLQTLARLGTPHRDLVRRRRRPRLRPPRRPRRPPPERPCLPRAGHRALNPRPGVAHPRKGAGPVGTVGGDGLRTHERRAASGSGAGRRRLAPRGVARAHGPTHGAASTPSYWVDLVTDRRTRRHRLRHLRGRPRSPVGASLQAGRPGRPGPRAARRGAARHSGRTDDVGHRPRPDRHHDPHRAVPRLDEDRLARPRQRGTGRMAGPDPQAAGGARSTSGAGSCPSAREATRRRRSKTATRMLFDEAADAVEVARRLWDSWEDDAEIRDAATGRFIDRDKLHFVDFEGEFFSVRGPSITPRPPQGQPRRRRPGPRRSGL